MNVGQNLDKMLVGLGLVFYAFGDEAGALLAFVGIAAFIWRKYSHSLTERVINPP